MYAVFEDGSRQYRVEEGDRVRLDYREIEPGEELVMDRVLVFQADSDLHIGRPLVEGATVIVEVLEHTSEKVTIQKIRRRKNYRRFKGHRQPYLYVEILDLLLPGMERKVRDEEEEDEDLPLQESDEETGQEYDDEEGEYEEGEEEYDEEEEESEDEGEVEEEEESEEEEDEQGEKKDTE